MLRFIALWVVIAIAMFVKVCHWIYRWRNPKCGGELPPGSMGFPIIGETIEFMKPHELDQLSPFMKKRISRYGPLFRTSLFGTKVIISADPEVNMEIAKASGFLVGSTQSLRRLFGENNLFTQSKEVHKYVRNLSYQFFGPEGLKRRMIHDIDYVTRKLMEVGARNGTLDVKETATDIIIQCLAKKVMGAMEPEAAKELELCWNAFRRISSQFPFNIRGTSAYELAKARKKTMKMLKDMIEKKKASKEGLGEFLEMIFREMQQEGAVLDTEKAVNFIFTLFLLSQETTPRATAATVKLIAGNPHVMEELQREHEAIVRSQTDKGTGLKWEDYKSMSFTHMVINESLRLTSTVPTVHRRTAHDFEIKGYTIPAGWLVLGYPLVHFDPEKYDDPFTFNPWRWKGEDLPATISKAYMPFGGGSRLCVGAEFAKLQIAVFIHHLSKYRWSLDKKTRVLRRYMLTFPNGCNVEISADATD